MDEKDVTRLVDTARKFLRDNGVYGLVEVDDVAAQDVREAFSETNERTWVRAWVFVPRDE